MSDLSTDVDDFGNFDEVEAGNEIRANHKVSIKDGAKPVQFTFKTSPEVKDMITAMMLKAQTEHGEKFTVTDIFIHGAQHYYDKYMK